MCYHVFNQDQLSFSNCFQLIFQCLYIRKLNHKQLILFRIAEKLVKNNWKMFYEKMNASYFNYIELLWIDEKSTTSDLKISPPIFPDPYCCSTGCPLYY